MKGCRALTDEEILKVSQKFTRNRDKVFFKLGLATGLRVSEILSLKVNSVFLGDNNTSKVILERKNMKGKHEGRIISINDTVANTIKEYIKNEGLEDNDFLFYSRKGSKAISRKQAWLVLSMAFESANVKGAVSCHSMRKTMATKVFKLSNNNLALTQKCLGHKSVASTISYLAVGEEEASNIMTSIDVFKSAG